MHHLSASSQNGSHLGREHRPIRSTLERMFALIALGLPLPSFAAAEEPIAIAPPTNLGTFDGMGTEAHAINDAGMIVGEGRSPARNARELRANFFGFVKPSDGPLVGIDGPQTRSRPVEVNAHGIVLVQRGSTTSGSTKSAYWSAELGQIELEAPAGHYGVRAHDLDDAGNILAQVSPMGGGSEPFLFSISRKTWMAVSCAPAVRCFASGMNERGTLVGQIDAQPVVWDEASKPPRVLPVDPRLQNYLPEAINERGTIVGNADDAEGHDHVVVWRGPDYALQIVGEGTALALNDQEIIAGSCHGDTGERLRSTERPCLWDLNRKQRVELPGPSGGDARGYAADVNNNGVAVGTVLVDETAVRAVRWETSITAP